MADRVLVTGATGFLGAELVRQLLQRGFAVRIFRRPTSSLERLGPLAREVEHAVGDLLDYPALREAMQGVRYVFHAAARVRFDRRAREELHLVNVEGTGLVVDTALEAGVERLVYTSSVAALGRPKNPEVLIDEETPWEDSPYNTAYALSKREAEREVFRGMAEGLDAVVVNPSLIMGPGRVPGNTYEIVRRLASGRLPAVPPGGTAVVDVADAALGHILALERGRTGARYILSGENLSWQTILEELARALQVELPRRRVPYPLALGVGALMEFRAMLQRKPAVFTRETVRMAYRTYRYSHARAREELGWQPRPFRETARRIAEYFLNHENA